jgi:hypothetical protein
VGRERCGPPPPISRRRNLEDASAPDGKQLVVVHGYEGGWPNLVLNSGQMAAMAVPAPGVQLAFVAPGPDRQRYAPLPAPATYYI